MMGILLPELMEVIFPRSCIQDFLIFNFSYSFQSTSLKTHTSSVPYKFTFRFQYYPRTVLHFDNQFTVNLTNHARARKKAEDY